MGKNRRSTVFLSTKEDEEKEPTSYYHDLEASNDDRDEERRRLRLKQGKLLPRDPWGPGEFVSSCSLQERAYSKELGRAADRAESTEKFFEEVTDVKAAWRLLPQARREVRRDAGGAQFFVDWECRNHRFAFDAGVSFLTTVDRGCILPHLRRISRRRRFLVSIRNLSRRAPQVLFDRGMGEYGWAQECEEDWDTVGTAWVWRTWSPADFVACCLQWIGSDSIDHFEWGHAPCYVQPGRLDRCPLPVLDAALRLCAAAFP